MADVTWSSVISGFTEAIVSYASTYCNNVGKTGSVPSGFTNRIEFTKNEVGSTSLVNLNISRPTKTKSGHNTTVTFTQDHWYQYGAGTTTGNTIKYPVLWSSTGFPTGLLTAVPVDTVRSEFQTYIQQYVPDVNAVVTQTRLSAIALQAVFFIRNKFVKYVASGAGNIYYKSNAFVGSAYVGSSVGFFDSIDLNHSSTTLSQIQNAIKSTTQQGVVINFLTGHTASATSSTSSCSSSSSTSSSCSSSSCSSSSSSSSSSNSCCSSSCSCWFIAFYDIGVM